MSWMETGTTRQKPDECSFAINSSCVWKHGCREVSRVRDFWLVRSMVASKHAGTCSGIEPMNVASFLIANVSAAPDWPATSPNLS